MWHTNLNTNWDSFQCSQKIYKKTRKKLPKSLITDVYFNFLNMKKKINEIKAENHIKRVLFSFPKYFKRKVKKNCLPIGHIGHEWKWRQGRNYRDFWLFSGWNLTVFKKLLKITIANSGIKIVRKYLNLTVCWSKLKSEDLF